MARPATGIRVRHTRTCRERTGGNCNCSPSFEAWVYSRRDGGKIRKTFPTLAAAKGWRADATGSIRRGTMRAPTATTLQQAWDAWLAGAKDGSVRTRSGDVYKPSVIRGYETSMRLRVLDELGAVKLSDIARVDVQDLADRMLAKGADPSTIRNTLMPLRAIFRRAIARGEVAVNPTSAVELPAVRGKRDRIASPDEAAKLLAALSDNDRGVWAAAFYAGLRRGELAALAWEHVDLAGNVIRVERSWDVQAGLIEPKSKAGRRTVPIPTGLREHLIAHRLRAGRSEGFVFGRSASVPFEPVTVSARAETAWKAAQLEPITLHEARHTFASFMIAAGVNAKALSTYMGHSSIAITLDRYGHLMPGNEAEAAGLLDEYLENAVKTASHP
jgi:integrase